MQVAGFAVAPYGAVQQEAGDRVAGGFASVAPSAAVAGVAGGAGGTRLGACTTWTPEGRRLVEVAIVRLVFHVMGEQDAKLELVLTFNFAVVVRPSVPVHAVVPRSGIPEGAVTTWPP